MNHKLMFSFALFVLFLIGNNSFAQDNSSPKWIRDVSTRANVLGTYNQLPTVEQPVKSTGTKLYHTTNGDVVVPANVRPYPAPAGQTESEVAAVTMVGNSNVMYASWNSYGPSTFWGTGFCFTNNGGASWTGNYVMIQAGNNGDPGPWVWSSTSPYPGRLGLSVIGSAGISATYSTDNGVTWAAFVSAGGSSTDKNLSCVDDVPGSPFLGRAYTVWTDFGGTNINRIVGAYTSNGGTSWTGYQAIAPVPASGHHCQGCDCVVGPGGVVYVCWAYCTTNGQNSTENDLGFAKSTDGGVTWINATNTAVPTNGMRAASFLSTGIRMNGFPRMACDKSGGSRNGYVYAVMGEKTVAPARDNGDICIMRTTDGGTTWTHTLVNGDAAGNLQFEPSVAVDQSNGNVGVGYYDERNTTTPVTQYYLSWSNNGGASWTDLQVSDHNFTPSPIPGLAGGYQGDYTGITYSNSKFYPFWADNSSGIYQIWTAGVSTVVLAHDYSCGPFLSAPPLFLINTSYPIKTKVSNLGSSAETSVPVKFFIDGVLTNTTNLSLAAGGVDSVTNNWMTPGTAGVHNLMYVTALGTDLDRTNDTVRMTANVLTAPPPTICPFFCQPTTTYTAISGSPGPVGDDVGLSAPIGFTFNYVGTNYTQVWICTNGFLQLGPSGQTDYVNALCGADVNLIAPFWDDLNTTNGGNIQYTTSGSAPNRIFTCQWTNVAYFSGTGNVTMQIKLYENGGTGGAIDFVYGPATNNAASSGSVGMNVQPGGSGNVQSVTPGSTCGNTTSSTTTCNDAVVYNFANGTLYRFCQLTGVNPVTNTVPSVFTLEQNYPNPFNPTTNIKFGIPKAGLVKLVVYDILGRVVETLVNEYKEAGTYKVDFDASRFASGVYLYKIESGDFSSVKKMLLVK